MSYSSRKPWDELMHSGEGEFVAALNIDFWNLTCTYTKCYFNRLTYFLEEKIWLTFLFLFFFSDIITII